MATRFKKGNAFQEEATEEDLRLRFKYDFQHVLECRKSLGQTTISPLMHTKGQSNKNSEDNGIEQVPHDGGELPHGGGERAA